MKLLNAPTFRLPTFRFRHEQLHLGLGASAADEASVFQSCFQDFVVKTKLPWPGFSEIFCRTLTWNTSPKPSSCVLCLSVEASQFHGDPLIGFSRLGTCAPVRVALATSNTSSQLVYPGTDNTGARRPAATCPGDHALALWAAQYMHCGYAQVD